MVQFGHGSVGQCGQDAFVSCCKRMIDDITNRKKYPDGATNGESGKRESGSGNSRNGESGGNNVATIGRRQGYGDDDE
jgi:hypothetical protein